MRALMLIVVLGVGLPAVAADTPKAAETFPLRIPAPHGEVILPSKESKVAHDEWHYSAIRRVDDMLYLSGQIIGRRPDEGNDAAAFRLQVRRGFERLQRTLATAGASFADVVMINSFHVWNSPHFAGTREEHFKVVEAVAAEFLKPPYPAWTAVGTTGLLSDTGLIEIQLVARVP